MISNFFPSPIIRKWSLLRILGFFLVLALVQSPNTAFATADAAAINADIAKKLAASIKRGRNVFQNRAGCTECHMWDGVGGEDTNVATLVGLTLNSEEIQKVVACGLPETSMWAFAPSACTADARSKNAPKQISGRDLVDVANYVAEVLAKGVTLDECQTVNGANAEVCKSLTN